MAIEVGAEREVGAEGVAESGVGRGAGAAAGEARRAGASGQRERTGLERRRTWKAGGPAEATTLEAARRPGPEAAGEMATPVVFSGGDELRRGRRSEASARLEALLVTGEEALRLELARW